MNVDLCFAYGADTNDEDWRGWCARNAADPSSVSPAGAALLPDRGPAFDHYCEIPGGRALDLRERVGGYVEGVLLRVSSAGWGALDRRQGVPDFRERVSRTVILPGGAAVTAIVYELARDRTGTFARPADDRLGIVRGEEGCHVLADVFAYGTLMQGEVRHAPAARAGLVSVSSAGARGRLHDFGAYPGLVLAAEGAGREVQGELLTFRDAARALPALDRIEGARPSCAPGALYRRTIVTVTDASGRSRRAWAYVVEAARAAAAPVIASGSWRRRRPI
ncbi:MAG TPA: gamma-glutamylcyclotransferase [Acetobacteraceae bacterium]|jgi:gamma-glutamylcyclotransferase (GGCT)/AIG2-like uncharacterized protein YtfP|nr:gamma-glutamylcyclotransferase [Acetobacteraceae bacterium]